MPTPFFPSAGQGRAQEIPKLLSGQEVSRAQQLSFSLLPRVELTLKLCSTSDCCRLLCRIVSPVQTVSSGWQITTDIGR